MTFGCEVHDGARPVLGQQAVDPRAVADVAVDEGVARVAVKACEVLVVAGVDYRVQGDDGLCAGIGRGQPVENEVVADEAGAAGEEEGSARAFFRLDFCLQPFALIS